MVYVLDIDGNPLMPTERHGKVRRLLKEGKAKVVKRCPFTIQLLYDSTRYTQEINLGIDAGSKHIGVSATTKEKELYAADVELRNDIVDLISTRREMRKTRYREARFNNRVSTKKTGWLAPSIKQKIQTHLTVIANIYKILPVASLIVETASFDIQKIKNPDISGEEYQQGEQLGFWNIREYVLLKILREIREGVNNVNVEEYKAHPDAFNYAFNHEFVSLSKRDAYRFLMYICSNWDRNELRYTYGNKFFNICDRYGYTPKSLLNYIDYLVTYEALSPDYPSKILGEIDDNCNMLSQMSDKYDRYPRHFLTSHQITSRTYQRWKEQFNEELFSKRVNKKMEIVINGYKFIYPSKTEDIKNEAVQQSNCVVSYIDRVINGQCDIIFMRNANTPNESLVTVEIRNKKVVQARRRFNESVTDEQQKVLNKYETFLSNL